MPGPTAGGAVPAGRPRTLAQVYRHFGEVDAAGTSPLYERVAVALSESGEALRAIEAAPARKRSPAVILAALHDLRDDKGQPLKLVHGALSPESVLVADDGVAEIARPFSVAPQNFNGTAGPGTLVITAVAFFAKRPRIRSCTGLAIRAISRC